MQVQSTAKQVGLWAGFLPAAFGGALLVYWVVRLGMQIMLSAPFLNPDSFFLRGLVEIFSSLMMGVVFVYFGVRVAPTHKTIVGYALSGVGLFLGGLMLYPAFTHGDYWAIWSCIWFAVGLAAAAFSVKSGELVRE